MLTIDNTVIVEGDPNKKGVVIGIWEEHNNPGGNKYEIMFQDGTQEWFATKDVKKEHQYNKVCTTLKKNLILMPLTKHSVS